MTSFTTLYSFSLLHFQNSDEYKGSLEYEKVSPDETCKTRLVQVLSRSETDLSPLRKSSVEITGRCWGEWKENEYEMGGC